MGGGGGRGGEVSSMGWAEGRVFNGTESGQMTKIKFQKNKQEPVHLVSHLGWMIVRIPKVTQTRIFKIQAWTQVENKKTMKSQHDFVSC